MIPIKYDIGYMWVLIAWMVLFIYIFLKKHRLLLGEKAYLPVDIE